MIVVEHVGLVIAEAHSVPEASGCRVHTGMQRFQRFCQRGHSCGLGSSIGSLGNLRVPI